MSINSSDIQQFILSLACIREKAYNMADSHMGRSWQHLAMQQILPYHSLT